MFCVAIPICFDSMWNVSNILRICHISVSEMLNWCFASISLSPRLSLVSSLQFSTHVSDMDFILFIFPGADPGFLGRWFIGGVGMLILLIFLKQIS